MRITDVRVVLHERRSQARLPFGIGTGGTVPFGVLTIQTDEGIEGTTFLSFPAGARYGLAKRGRRSRATRSCCSSLAKVTRW
jgi:hypothetical protein